MVNEYNQKAQETGQVPLLTFEINHSRGSLASSIATQEQVKAGDSNVPLGKVQFNGAAANAERMANVVNDAASGQATVWESTHVNDFVGGVIGGNEVTGGQESSFVNAHGNYGEGANEALKEKVWGSESGSASIKISPKN